MSNYFLYIYIYYAVLMAVPKHRKTLTKKKLKYKINKKFINRSFFFNELQIYNKLNKNELDMPYYFLSIFSKKLSV